MAKLENLKNFDRELNAAFDKIEALDRKRSLAKGVWSQQQQDQFVELQSIVGRLANAVSELVNANR
jgi:hypothetical protein